jgi:ADP-ribosyl-[dinitrogen reductase] hydrolase
VSLVGTNGAVKDRAVGCLLGLAVGDALGTTLEFQARDRHPPLTEIVGGGPFQLRPGVWTDDTSMALCLADSLIARRDLDQWDLMERFLRWHEEGENAVDGWVFDIGLTTRSALRRYRETGNAVAGSRDPHSAGNGSLMRLAPVPIRWHCDSARAALEARRQSETTHAADAVMDGCAYFAGLLVQAIAGDDKSVVLSPQAFDGDPDIGAIAAGDWRGKERYEIHSSGYVVHTLEAALWAVDRAESFEEAVLTAANLADDADTVAAVTGQLAGALWGASGIPERWRRRVAWGADIERRAAALFETGCSG